MVFVLAQQELGFHELGGRRRRERKSKIEEGVQGRRRGEEDGRKEWMRKEKKVVKGSTCCEEVKRVLGSMTSRKCLNRPEKVPWS